LSLGHALKQTETWLGDQLRSLRNGKETTGDARDCAGERSGLSVTHSVTNMSAVIGHGTAAIIEADDADFDAVNALHTAAGWEPLRRQRRGVYVRIDPDRLFAWIGPEWPVAALPNG
jgi:hypothetical protein